MELKVGIFVGKNCGEQVKHVHLQASRVGLSKDGPHTALRGFTVQPDHGYRVTNQGFRHSVMEVFGAITRAATERSCRLRNQVRSLGEVKDHVGAFIGEQRGHGDHARREGCFPVGHTARNVGTEVRFHHAFFVDGEHCLQREDVGAERLVHVHIELASDSFVAEVHGVHDAVALQAVVEGGQTLLPVQEQHSWVVARVGRAFERAGPEPHFLVAGVQCHEAAHGVTTQYRHDECPYSVDIPAVIPLKIWKLKIPPINSGEKVNQVVT